MKIQRNEAIRLRRAGNSYGMIKFELGISKSTLSNWLGEIPFIPNRELISRMGRAKLKSALYKHRLKLENISRMKSEANLEIGRLSSRDLFMLGIGIYLGEGSKSQEEIRIVNADPAIIKVAMKWLMKFGKVRNEHFKVAVHGYPDHNIDEIVNYWSQTLNIPIQQFIKTTIDTRQNKSDNKKRKLPYGTAHLYIKSGGTLELGVKGLHRKIMGWIESSMKQI